MKKVGKVLLLVIVVLVGLVLVFAISNRISPLAFGHKQVNHTMFSDEAINGYDVVAYFTESKAIEGTEDHTHVWREASWNFSSSENKELFKANPETYAPQYGGYCAFAASKGFTANPEPDSFEIIDGKLYLFAGEEVKTEWLAQLEENIKAADKNW